MLYGFSILYGFSGETNLYVLADFFKSETFANNAIPLLASMVMVIVGFGFKIGAVPFHFWTPDVYEGSPTPVVAFMASAVKAAAFAGLLRVFVTAFEGYQQDWRPYVYALAVATMLVGSVLAVVQTDVKRMLAYSSISHAGFILVGVQAGTADGTASALFYLAAYTFMVVGSFGVVTDPERLESTVPALAYCSSKSAVTMLTLQYAKVLPEMRINVVDPGYTATDLNHHSGPQTVEQGTDAIVRLATIGKDGPTGTFQDAAGLLPW
jgi:proton-translocating NADH-quinone oxidoreductase chain N